MKKKRKSERDDELRPEYNLHEVLKGGVKGKYAERYRGWNEPDDDEDP